MPAYWLFKSEPDVFSWEMLKTRGRAGEPWDGVRNYQARNLLRDEDEDGIGDLTWVEAASTAIPYLSWAEVVIGDPLMRLRVGPGAIVSIEDWPGDATGNGFVDALDLLIVLDAYGASIGQPQYDPAADLDEDGFVGFQTICMETPRFCLFKRHSPYI